ncbi:Holliday junction branch migration protein RuvA [Candidatus Campbellbacteria bacterium CG10_big_fil_rev_8_21_14_0_10_35_52]|uniref:Holliday junction branch migration complex subunit RuvA n=1 Tax=Candidatus Campbellbacteria bacterium CG10_big_fil_rev_8_21_14_0_10_35_52 TaxID=1974527 RepID=A0A2M6WV49_9BACT|nr:MAG: Holliday junction branch migration protein RuvA [Candidatus Campbellbacteria bacterium CG10_big_fil_rev_8_21_14_0_10_35_52]
MIAQLKGTVAEIIGNSVILSVGGVGYKIYTTAETIKKIGKIKNKEIILKTHLAVRETSLDIYGFLDSEELRFFEMLISISGIGPKSAIAILSVADVETLKTAISTGESSYLTKVSGIGKKNAEKIILEFHDKFSAVENLKNSDAVKGEIDALEALQTLGYSQKEARDAMKKIEKNIIGSKDLLKEALKILGK